MAGEPIVGAIGDVGAADFFAFEAQAGTFYEIRVELDTLDDSVVAIYDRDERELAFNDDYGETAASRIVWQAPESVTYFVEVYGYDEAIGSYTLTVSELEIEDAHANDAAGATPVTIGEPVEASVDYAADIDYFSFEAEAGVIYQVDVELGTLGDSVVAIYDLDGWQLAFNDDYGDAGASRIHWSAETSTTLYVEVAAAYADGIGSYMLTVTEMGVDDHANQPDNATIVTVGEPIPSAIDYPDDFDLFAFDARAGVIYRVDVSLGTLADSSAAVFDADGFELAFNDDYGDSAASRIHWRTEASATLYVEVAAYADGVGSYTLTVTEMDVDDDHANHPDNATIVTVGESIPSAIDYPDDFDLFAFDARAGVIYRVDVSLGTLADSRAAIYADGSDLAFNDDYGDSAASRILWRSEADATAYVGVAGFGADVGSYTLTVSESDEADDHADSPEDATAIAVGSPTQGAVNYGGDTDFFSFEAQAGRVYQVDVTVGTLADSTVALTDADGMELAFNDDHERSASGLLWGAVDSGIVYVAVRGYDGDAGSYTLVVSELDIDDDEANSPAGATPLVVGASADGVIDYPRDVDLFSFRTEAGQTYQIDVGLGTLNDSVVTVLDGDGSELDFNDDFGEEGGSRVVWRATASATFYVEVAGYGDSVGSYTLTVVATSAAPAPTAGPTPTVAA